MGRHRKHAPEMMFEDINAYPKFIGADSDEAFQLAKELFSSIGLKSSRMSSTETSELSKLLETTYSGILIGWMHEIERLSNKYGVDWKETLQLPAAANQRIEFKRPTDIFPGFIGGHCIMPNIALLLQENESDYLTAVVNSNQRKQDEIKGS
jgi:UDP-N-acetyl-D-mannosaminuronate dehydrogenase